MGIRTDEYKVIGKKGITYRGIDSIKEGDFIQFEMYKESEKVGDSEYLMVINGELVNEQEKYRYMEIVTLMGLLEIE